MITYLIWGDNTRKIATILVLCYYYFTTYYYYFTTYYYTTITIKIIIYYDYNINIYWKEVIRSFFQDKI